MERLDEGNDDGNVGLDDVVMTGGQEEQAVSPAPQNNTGNASSAGVVCTAAPVVKLSQEGATGCRRCRQGRCTCSSSRTGGESMRKGQTNNRVVDCAQEHAGWDKRFQELRAFKDQYGHTIVPRSNMTLYRWVGAQRRSENNENDFKRAGEKGWGPPNEEKRRKLDSIGFAWDANASRASTVHGCQLEDNWESRCHSVVCV